MFTSIPIYFYPKLLDTSQKVQGVQQVIYGVLHRDGCLLVVSLECGLPAAAINIIVFLCLTLFSSISQADVCPHPLSHNERLSMNEAQG